MNKELVKEPVKKTTRIEKHSCSTTDPAYNVACYYGCHITPRIPWEKQDLIAIKAIKALEGDDSFTCAEDKVAVLKAFHEESIQHLPQPVMLWSEGTQADKKTRKRLIHLDQIGTEKSIAEATIIQAAIAILDEEGYKNLVVHINSIGSKESALKFQREITAYYKKSMASVSGICRQIFKKDPLYAHTCALEEGDEVAAKAPQAISFLSEEGRVHFQEVLEFLETLHIDYVISNGLVGHRGYSTDTIFTITADDEKGGSIIVAAGSRYNTLAKKCGYKKDVPAVGITLYLPQLDKTKRVVKPLKKSKFFFIQIGFEAKLKSLEVIEVLRKNKIPLYQSISRDKLSAQLSIAEHEKFPYIIIMGQKEALEESVLVRDTSTRCQDTVKIENLPEYLKKIS
jgi:histidyl-tRNA synthetase